MKRSTNVGHSSPIKIASNIGHTSAGINKVCDTIVANFGHTSPMNKATNFGHTLPIIIIRSTNIGSISPSCQMIREMYCRKLPSEATPKKETTMQLVHCINCHCLSIRHRVKISAVLCHMAYHEKGLNKQMLPYTQHCKRRSVYCMNGLQTTNRQKIDATDIKHTKLRDRNAPLTAQNSKIKSFKPQ